MAVTVEMPNSPVNSLFVVPWYALKPRTGGGQRSMIQMNGLRRAGALEVLVCQCSRNADISEFAAHFPGVTFSIHRTEPTERPGPFANFLSAFLPWRKFMMVSPSLRKTVLDCLAQRPAHVVVFRRLRVLAQSGLLAGDTQARIIVDLDDREDHKHAARITERYGAAATRAFLALYVRRGFRAVINRKLEPVKQAWLVSSKDKDGLALSDTRFVPNVPFTADLATVAGAENTKPVLLFVGNATYSPNANGLEWLLGEVWPKVVALAPDSRLRLVGTGNWSNLKARFGAVGSIEFVGEVDDLSAEYSQARAAAAPIFSGGGSQIKVVEGCGFARPVISSVFAVAGYDNPLAQAIDKTDDADRFAELCAAYLTNSDLAGQKGKELRSLKQAQYSKQSVVARVEGSVRELIKSEPSK